MKRQRGKQEGGTPETQLALGTYVKLLRASDSVTARLAAQITASGLSWSQFGTLEALYHVGPLCQKELGEKLLKSTGNITMVVDNLERRGLVRRERVAEDRRYVQVHLTECGHELIAALFPAHAEAIRQQMSALTAEEQEELGRLCRKLGLHAAATDS
jgi:MarR family 2-MHQ and catechol resistance regulon transcriptional repressor